MIALNKQQCLPTEPLCRYKLGKSIIGNYKGAGITHFTLKSINYYRFNTFEKVSC